MLVFDRLITMYSLKKCIYFLIMRMAEVSHSYILGVQQ